MFWKKKPSFKALEVSDSTFNKLVTESEIPVLVDFYASWCGPCKILGPIIDELAEEYQGKALVAKVNTEHNPALSAHFKIKSIPTMMVFNKGAFQEKFNGLIPKPNLEEILDEYISSANEDGSVSAVENNHGSANQEQE